MRITQLARLPLAVVVVLALVCRVHAADDAYAALAEALASPVATDADQAIAAHSDKVVMLRMEVARQQLMALKSWPTDLASSRYKLLVPLDNAHASLEKLRELDRTVPDFEGVAKKGLDAGPGLIKIAMKKDGDLTDEDKRALGELGAKAGWELGKAVVNAIRARMERDTYQKAYATLRSESVQAFVKAFPARYKGVEKYKGDKAADKAVELRFSGSWNNTFINDFLSMRNATGKDLTNCTVVVRLRGYNAKTHAKESDSHIHYVAKWPAGQWLNASYPSRAKDGIATNESADAVEAITVTLYSDQCRDEIDYTYIGKDYDQDVEHNFEKRVKPTFTGQWYSYDNHTFFNNGFQFWYDGDLDSFPVWYITVRAKQGGIKKAVKFTASDFRMSKGSKKWLSSETFNGLNNPDSVVVEFEFPRSSYSYKATWDYKK